MTFFIDIVAKFRYNINIEKGVRLLKYILITLLIFLTGCAKNEPIQEKEVIPSKDLVPYCIADKGVVHVFTNATSLPKKTRNITIQCIK